MSTMYDHIALKVRDLARSIRFYSAVLAPLGCELCSRDDASAGFGPPGAPALWLYAGAGKGPAATHVAFAATARSAVDRFHAAGGREHGAPGLRTD